MAPLISAWTSRSPHGPRRRQNVAPRPARDDNEQRWMACLRPGRARLRVSPCTEPAPAAAPRRAPALINPGPAEVLPNSPLCLGRPGSRRWAEQRTGMPTAPPRPDSNRPSLSLGSQNRSLPTPKRLLDRRRPGSQITGCCFGRPQTVSRSLAWPEPNRSDGSMFVRGAVCVSTGVVHVSAPQARRAPRSGRLLSGESESARRDSQPRRRRRG